jgi:hypothetical protein
MLREAMNTVKATADTEPVAPEPEFKKKLEE